MPQTIKHATLATGIDAGDGEIGKAAWNADHTVTGTPDLPEYASNTAPSAPASGATMFSRVVATRRLPAYIGPSGLDSSLQASLARNKIALWAATGNNTLVSTMGAVSLTASGAVTTANVSLTNRHTIMKRSDYLVTTAATTAAAGWRGHASQYARGVNPGDGGFFYVCRWGPATGVTIATHRGFVGLRRDMNPAADANPSSFPDMVGMGWDSGDTNISFMHNDNTGTATKVDLGASFPRPSADRTKMYEIAMFCAPAGSSIGWEVQDLATGAVASGTASTDIPAATVLMGPWGMLSVGGTSSVVGIALSSLYIETDY